MNGLVKLVTLLTAAAFGTFISDVEASDAVNPFAKYKKPEKRTSANIFDQYRSGTMQSKVFDTTGMRPDEIALERFMIDPKNRRNIEQYGFPFIYEDEDIDRFELEFNNYYGTYLNVNPSLVSDIGSILEKAMEEYINLVDSLQGDDKKIAISRGLLYAALHRSEAIKLAKEFSSDMYDLIDFDDFDECERNIWNDKTGFYFDEDPDSPIYSSLSTIENFILKAFQERANLIKELADSTKITQADLDNFLAKPKIRTSISTNNYLIVALADDVDAFEGYWTYKKRLDLSSHLPNAKRLENAFNKGLQEYLCEFDNLDEDEQKEAIAEGITYYVTQKPHIRFLMEQCEDPDIRVKPIEHLREDSLCVRYWKRRSPTIWLSYIQDEAKAEELIIQGLVFYDKVRKSTEHAGPHFKLVQGFRDAALKQPDIAKLYNSSGKPKIDLADLKGKDDLYFTVNKNGITIDVETFRQSRMNYLVRTSLQEFGKLTGRIR